MFGQAKLDSNNNSSRTVSSMLHKGNSRNSEWSHRLDNVLVQSSFLVKRLFNNSLSNKQKQRAKVEEVLLNMHNFSLSSSGFRIRNIIIKLFTCIALAGPALLASASNNLLQQKYSQQQKQKHSNIHPFSFLMVVLLHVLCSGKSWSQTNAKARTWAFLLRIIN